MSNEKTRPAPVTRVVHVELTIDLPTLCDVTAFFDEDKQEAHVIAVSAKEHAIPTVRDVYERLPVHQLDNAVSAAWYPDEGDGDGEDDEPESKPDFDFRSVLGGRYDRHIRSFEARLKTEVMRAFSSALEIDTFFVPFEEVNLEGAPEVVVRALVDAVAVSVRDFVPHSWAFKVDREGDLIIASIRPWASRE